MSLLKRFNPYGLPDAVVDALATGRETALHDVLAEIAANRARRPVQHVLLTAPRGFGKSFFLRMVQIALRDEPGIGFVLLPEEQPNIVRPALLLEEIRRALEQRPASDVGIRRDLGPDAWATSAAALDAAIRAKLGPDGLLVVGIENFDDLLRDVFGDPAAAQQLRGLLTREDGRLMLLATSTTVPDGDPAAPLYQAYTPLGLLLWGEEECLGFYDRIRAQNGRPALTEAERARVRAIAVFAGGSPRIATVLYEVLESRDADSAAAALDALVDELSDYYRDRIRALSPRARGLLDTLLRHGEPRSQSEIAALMGEDQARIAEPFQELLVSQVLSGGASERQGARESVYQVTDRLFAHFYRLRYFDPEGRLPRLERIADFLAGFFTAEEKREEARKLREAGREADAAVYERLLSGPRHLALDAPGVARDGAKGTPEARLAAAEQALRQAREAGDAKAEIAALLALGLEQELLGQHETAIAKLRDALARAETAGDLRGQAMALRRIGWNQGRMGALDAAIATLRNALARAETAGDMSEQARALSLIGWIQGRMGAHEAAIATLRDAIARAETAGDVYGQGLALRYIGRSQGEMGAHDAAIATLRDALARAETVGDIEAQSSALGYIAWVESQMGAHDAGIATLRDALARIAAADHAPEHVLTLLRIGWIQRQQGAHDAAIATLRDALARAEAAGDTSEQAEALRLIGWIQGQQGAHDTSIATLRDALARAEAAGDVGVQAGALRDIGWSQSLTGAHDAAIATLRDALARAEAAGDIREQAEALRHIGWSQSKQGAHDAAIATLRDALARAETAGDSREQAEALRFILLFGWQGRLILPDLVPLFRRLADRAPDRAALHLDNAVGLAVLGRDVPALLAVVAAHPTAFAAADTTWSANSAATAIAERFAAQGRAAAYADAAPLLETLARTEPFPKDSRFTPAALLTALVNELLRRIADTGLLRDLADLLDRLAPEAQATGIALLRARATDLDHPDDPAALERFDPDIAAAIRRIRGVTDPAELFRRGKPKPPPRKRPRKTR